MNRFGYLKVAAAVPHVRVADCRWNAGRAVELIERAAERGAALVVFPELSLTGYTCGDLFLQSGLLRAAEESLADLLRRTADLPLAAIVGMPVPLGPALYNCAVVIGGGTIRGVVPKTFIPNYSEFYEARHFSSGADTELTTCRLCGQEVPFGRDLLFRLGDYATMGIEICEDMWVPLSPSLAQAVDGAEVLVNLSASPESAGKHDYLRALVRQQSERAKAAYIYCSAGFGESSTDLSFAGNGIIVENGAMLRETERFCTEEQLVAADVDIELLVTARRRTSTFAQHRQEAAHRVIAVPVGASSSGAFERPIPRNPYMPSGGEELAVRCREVLDIQSWGLMQRLDHTGCRHAVLGISGGLDSTLALLVVVRAFDKLGYDRRGIVGITMPGFGTSDRTYANAMELMRELGVTLREIPIRKACEQHFADIGLDPRDRSATYENAQARERTQILMDVANQVGGLVIGTGDLSELALGWATYNGDQMSMYGVNASVPKTMVRQIVGWAADDAANPRVAAILRDVVATPVSPELLPPDGADAPAQETERVVGPYELHDFFLYHFVWSGFSAAKILFLAEQAFRGKYDRPTLTRWLKVFIRRFFAQQFKRSAMPDGPKVGAVSLSPRGDWRMPSDAAAEEWLRETDESQND